MLTSSVKIIMVGVLPPPVHGMAMVNAAVLEKLRSRETGLLVVNMAARSLKRSVINRLSRIPRCMHGLIRLLVAPKQTDASLYMSVSGGYGQSYELAFILFARLCRMRIFLHHHSFSYLNSPSHLTKWLIVAAGLDATHIALSPGMAEKIKNIYKIKNTLSISNAVFFPSDSINSSVRKQIETIGFLGNITSEKGIFDFLDLVSAIQVEGINLKAKLAGPFQDKGIEQLVRQRLKKLPMIEYVGPKYGMEKDVFYSDIDLLIFPTIYENEAEPMTIHEAMSHGVPVIAYGRGSIPEIVVRGCGLVIAPDTPFVPAALAQIKIWLRCQSIFEKVSEAAINNFSKTYAENSQHWQLLMANLIGENSDL